MDRRITATVEVDPSVTIAALADLATYPHWLTLVSAAEPVDPGEGVGAGITGEPPTWNVTIKAQLGPLARSKRLRMTRTDLDEARVKFERAEIDGRRHAEWILEAFVVPSPTTEGGSDVLVHLYYGGALWSTPLEMVLATFEGTAGARLDKYLRTH